MATGMEDQAHTGSKNMKHFEYKGWLQLSANVAILAGVVLVIFQLRQNAELLELQILKQEADSYIAGELMMIGENYADTWQKMLEEPENLNLAELRAIESHLWAHDIVRWRNLYDLHTSGLLDENAWKRLAGEDLEYELAHPYGRAWWEEIKENNNIDLPRELVEFVDDGLAKAPHNAPVAAFNRTLESVKKKSELDPSEP
jgi:hypothetical protein